MLYLLSFINLIKNIVVKIWSYKPVRVVVSLGFAYYLINRFGTNTMARATNADLSFPGWDAIFYMPEFGFNPNFIKSGKANYGWATALTKISSVFAPGLLFVGVILFLQKVWNTFQAPPLPLLYRGEDAEDVIVEDYRMPVLFTKGEAEYDDEEDELDE